MGAREERFRALFEDTYGPLWAYARRRVSADDVEDVVADTLTVAWRRLQHVPDGDGALPWLYRVAANTIANRRRSGRRHLRLVARLRAEPLANEPPSQPAVLEAFADLRPAEREVLRLAAWEGLGPAQIGVVLGCSANAAALRLSRARARLRARLTGSGDSRTDARGKEIDV